MSLLLACPNCAAIWGSEEIDEQQCYACGYPNQCEDDDDFDDGDHEPDMNGPTRTELAEQERQRRIDAQRLK